MTRENPPAPDLRIRKFLDGSNSHRSQIEGWSGTLEMVRFLPDVSIVSMVVHARMGAASDSHFTREHYAVSENEIRYLGGVAPGAETLRIITFN